MAGTQVDAGSRVLREVREERWRARPIVAGLIRAVVLVVPLGAGIIAGLLAARVIRGAGLGLAGLLVVLVASTAAILATERLARRLLPLAMLLRLSLVFPDRAPARVRVAMRAGNLRRLTRWAEAEHHTGAAPDAGCAAERVLSLVTALGAHDRRTRGHSERVRALVEVLGAEMGLDQADLDKLRWSGLLHDLGKLSVPSAILNKPAKPTAAEWATLQEHPAEGMRLAGPLVEWLGDWAHGIDEHHERWDGGGYPYGHSDTEISLAGRIVAVADAFECMTEVRSYQRPRSYADARTEITRCAGSQFDPAVVRALQTMSLSRLHWVMGPISWVAQVPFLGAVPRTGMELANMASAATIGTVAQVATAAALIAAPGSVATAAAFEQPAIATMASTTSSAPVDGYEGAGSSDLIAADYRPGDGAGAGIGGEAGGTSVAAVRVRAPRADGQSENLDGVNRAARSLANQSVAAGVADERLDPGRVSADRSASQSTGPPAHATGPPAHATGPPAELPGPPLHAPGPPPHAPGPPVDHGRPPAH